jgi:hypothetical protein
MKTSNFKTVWILNVLDFEVYLNFGLLFFGIFLRITADILYPPLN